MIRQATAQVSSLYGAIQVIDDQYQAAARSIVESKSNKISKSMCDGFQTLHRRTEQVLYDLMNFVDISIDRKPKPGAAKDVVHRYHEAVIEAVMADENPLQVLKCQEVKEVLQSWRQWRNEWAKREENAKLQRKGEGIKAFLKMPTLIRKIKEAIEEADTIARSGTQVYMLRRETEQEMMERMDQDLAEKRRNWIQAHHNLSEA